MKPTVSVRNERPTARAFDEAGAGSRVTNSWSAA